MELALPHDLIVSSEENRELIKSNDKCDKYDYLAAVGCGAIAGIVDIFLVGAPRDSMLGNWTDEQTDKAVKKFAKLLGWSPKEKNKDSVASAIGFLEKKFKVNYDHRHSEDVDKLFKMSTKNHHMKSLGHSPDIIGLFFSILNQFTSTASFIADGKIITIETETFELQGNNLISKIFCGIANWFGHLMSDIAGSSGGRGGDGRCSGLAMPFYELFGFCKFGKFKVGKDKQDLATIATRAFQEGYDFRHGMTMAIPVLITDLSIRLIWALRRRFQYDMPIKECIPNQKHSSLRVMLLFGNGTLCMIDGLDAGIKSGGNYLTFFMQLNLIAWFRFVSLVLKEICIRIGIVNPLDAYLESYRVINEALLVYLDELKKIDIELYRKETEKYNQTIAIFRNARSSEELNLMLIGTYESLGIKKPWQGDFDEFMSDENNRLTFE